MNVYISHKKGSRLHKMLNKTERMALKVELIV